MKKCPPGILCIDNRSLLIIITVLIVIISMMIYGNFFSQIRSNNTSEKIIVQQNGQDGCGATAVGYPIMPNYPYSNMPNDVLLNPYAAPLKDERYFTRPIGMVPINVSTNIGAVDTEYRQVGFLTGVNEKEKVIPLMGRPLYVNRDKWQYYTISNQRNSIKLPIIKNNCNCTNEYGCDRLFSGDVVFVDGLNSQYKITLYENNTIKYLPFL